MAIEKVSVSHSCISKPMNVAPSRNVSQIQRRMDGMSPCFTRCDAICMVALDDSRMNVATSRIASTLTSGGAQIGDVDRSV